MHCHIDIGIARLQDLGCSSNNIQFSFQQNMSEHALLRVNKEQKDSNILLKQTKLDNSSNAKTTKSIHRTSLTGANICISL